MSTDLIENNDEDTDGNAVSLTVYAKRNAILTIMEKDPNGKIVDLKLSPNEYGLKLAKTIRNALDVWIDLVENR